MNIVFLDIDGVLRSYESEFIFYDYDERLIKRLSEKYNIDYFQYNYDDVIATYYEWDSRVVSRLKNILEKTTSKIITSSDWKDAKNPNKMRDLLTMKGLEKYYFCDNITLKEKDFAYRRSLEIKDSLNRYNITNYVILDNEKGLEKYFPNNIVVTNDLLSINDMNEAIKILKRK